MSYCRGAAPPSAPRVSRWWTPVLTSEKAARCGLTARDSLRLLHRLVPAETLSLCACAGSGTGTLPK